MIKNLSELRPFCQQFALAEVWSADATNKGYKHIRTSKSAKTQCLVLERFKKYSSVWFTQISLTQEHYLFMVGLALCAGCCQKMFLIQPGFQYKNNKKAWMTMYFFFASLSVFFFFDFYTSRSSGRNNWLLMNYFSKMAQQDVYRFFLLLL